MPLPVSWCMLVICCQCSQGCTGKLVIINTAADSPHQAVHSIGLSVDGHVLAPIDVLAPHRLPGGILNKQPSTPVFAVSSSFLSASSGPNIIPWHLFAA